MKKLFIVGVVFAVTSFPISVFSQTEEQRKYQLAQTYEKDGDFANSSRIYKDLWTSNKKKEEYFSGLQRTLLALGKYIDLSQYVNEELQVRKTVPLYALQGDLFWKIGKSSAADSVWAYAISAEKNNPSTYSTIAKAQFDNKLSEKAVNTLLQARAVLNDKNLFSEELSVLFALVGRYNEGINENLLLLEKNNNINTIQGRLTAYLQSEKGAKETEYAIAQAVKNSPTNSQYLLLYEWIERELKNYDKALEVRIQLDNLLGAQGREILAFADLARAEGEINSASKAYKIIIDKGSSSPFAQTALYGFARVMEQRLDKSKKERTNIDNAEAESIIKTYNTIISEYPNTPFAAESYLRLGFLYKNVLKNSSKAIETFFKLYNQYRNTDPGANAAIELANSLIDVGELDRAEQVFTNAVTAYPQYQVQADKGRFGLAELLYYRGNIDSSRSLYGQLAVHTNADIANDALERISLLEDTKEKVDKDAIKTYAKAELLERQEKIQNAIEEFLSIHTFAPKNPTAERGFVRAALLQLRSNKPAESRKIIDSLFSKFPQSIVGDQALIVTGDAFTLEGNTSEAIIAYSKLLEQFPRSSFVTEARQKIRKLRGA